MTTPSHTALWTARILSAASLFAAGLIHVILVVEGRDGVIGMLFVLNGIAGIVLAAGMLVTQGRLLRLTAVLSLVFMAVSLLAVTVPVMLGMIPPGAHLAVETIVLESIGTAVLAVATAVVLRGSRSPALSRA